MKIFKFLTIFLLFSTIALKRKHISSTKNSISQTKFAKSITPQIAKKLASRLARLKSSNRRLFPSEFDLSNISGQAYGTIAGLGGAILTKWGRKKQRKTINKLKRELASQSTVLMMRHNQYNQVLGSIHESITGLSDQIDTMRLEVRQKIEQYEGYVKSELRSLEYSVGLIKFKPRS